MAAVEDTVPVVLAAEAPAGAPASEEKEEVEIPKPDMNVKQPDEEEFTAAVEAVQARLDGHHKRIAEIKAVLDARENVKNASSGESGQARARLQELRAQSRALSGERNAIYQEISEQEDLRKLRIASMAELRKAIPYSSVEEIDRAIKEKEHYQETNALPLNAIKKLMAEVKEMQASKPRVKELHLVTEQLKLDKETQNTLYAKLKEKTTEVNGVRDIERKASEEVERIRKKTEGSRSDVPGMIKERDESKKLISSCHDELKKLRDENFKGKKAFSQAQYLMKRWMNQERQKEWKARETERDDRRKARQAEEALRVPYEDEMALCDQLVAYMGRYVVAEKVVVAVVAAPEPVAVATAGVVVVNKKGLAEEDFYVGKKVAKKKGKKPTDAATIKVSHTPEVFASFGKLQLRAPIVAGECAEAIELIKAKKEWFKTAPPKSEIKKLEDDAKRAAAVAAEAMAAEAAKAAEAAAAAAAAEEELAAVAAAAAAAAVATEEMAAKAAAVAAEAAAAKAAKSAAEAKASQPAPAAKAAPIVAPAPVAAKEVVSAPASTGGCTLSISPISDTGVLVSITIS
ncbi:hypothetical protein T492DRAFT_926793 [Pavlovales sp. CCMP2436]|nr:hypothetical protein T492DRAFT_926793 [Pavlovales sp. CCMP2436]